MNVGALGIAALFGALACRKQLTVAPTSVLAPLLAAPALCASFSLLAPFWFPPGLVARWLVSLGIVTLLALPLSLRLWGMWLFAVVGVMREHRMKVRARAAIGGEAHDTLAARIEAYGDDVVTLSIPSDGLVTMSKQQLPSNMAGNAFVGSWLLFEMPRITPLSVGSLRLDAARGEYVGGNPLIDTDWFAGEVVIGAFAWRRPSASLACLRW